MPRSRPQRRISSPTLGRIGRLATGSQILFELAAISLLCALIGCGSGSTGSHVTAAPTLTFSASSSSIATGQAVTLTWQTTNATSVAISATGADGSIRQISTSSQLSGSVQDKPTQTTTYAATATGAGGSAQGQAKVAVNQPAPTLTFTAAAAPDDGQVAARHLDRNHCRGRRWSHPANLHREQSSFRPADRRHNLHCRSHWARRRYHFAGGGCLGDATAAPNPGFQRKQ